VDCVYHWILFVYWILFVLSFGPMLYTLQDGLQHVIHCQAEPGYVLDGDLDLTKLSVFPIVFAGCIGIIGTLIGIGGGILMGPLLFTLNVSPNMASATTALMGMITSASVLIQYIALQELDGAVSAWNMFIGFVEGLIGRYGAVWLLKFLRRESIIIGCVIVTIVLSIGAIIYSLAQMGSDFTFVDFC
jgi:hypothetical protein